MTSERDSSLVMTPTPCAVAGSIMPTDSCTRAFTLFIYLLTYLLTCTEDRITSVFGDWPRGLWSIVSSFSANDYLVPPLVGPKIINVHTRYCMDSILYCGIARFALLIMHASCSYCSFSCFPCQPSVLWFLSFAAWNKPIDRLIGRWRHLAHEKKTFLCHETI